MPQRAAEAEPNLYIYAFRHKRQQKGPIRREEWRPSELVSVVKILLPCPAGGQGAVIEFLTYLCKRIQQVPEDEVEAGK